MFFVFSERIPFKLWSSTSLRQFNWRRSRYSSRDLGLDPCQGIIEDLLQSNDYTTTTCLRTTCAHVWYLGLHLRILSVTEECDDGLFSYHQTKPQRRHTDTSRLTGTWRPVVTSIGNSPQPISNRNQEILEKVDVPASAPTSVNPASSICWTGRSENLSTQLLLGHRPG